MTPRAKVVKLNSEKKSDKSQNNLSYEKFQINSYINWLLCKSLPFPLGKNVFID